MRRAQRRALPAREQRLAAQVRQRAARAPAEAVLQARAEQQAAPRAQPVLPQVQGVLLVLQVQLAAQDRLRGPAARQLLAAAARAPQAQEGQPEQLVPLVRQPSVKT